MGILGRAVVAGILEKLDSEGEAVGSNRDLARRKDGSLSTHYQDSTWPGKNSSSAFRLESKWVQLSGGDYGDRLTVDTALLAIVSGFFGFGLSTIPVVHDEPGPEPRLFVVVGVGFVSFCRVNRLSSFGTLILRLSAGME